jgi:hypothetical protein
MITQTNFDYLSDLYAIDAPEAWLLAEYPSSNSTETRFQNRDKYIIHDPFPPPRPELMQVLGPHHLMFGWGNHIPVTSQVEPPATLLDHWQHVFGKDIRPAWNPFDENRDYITLFPHESIPATRQVVHPNTNYAVHSKEVIEQIDCPQADVLPEVQPPCVVKLSHGYAGLGNFFVHNEDDEANMRQQLTEQWPSAKLVVNSLIENINGDFGVQFYLRKSGEIVWLGFTEQNFDDNTRWCGGTFTAALQSEMLPHFEPFIEAAAAYLHTVGYFGVVGIDLLRDASNRFYLVDVNPRLTGISPFLIASRIFARDGIANGIYKASCRFKGSLSELIDTASAIQDARVIVLSAFEDNKETLCHLSASSDSLERSLETLDKLA